MRIDVPSEPDPEWIDENAPETIPAWFAKARPATEVLVGLLGETTAEELLKPKNGDPPTSTRTSALERLLAIAPALEVTGTRPMSEKDIFEEVHATRLERRARRATAVAGK